MTVLIGIDLETTSLDVTICEITEIGIALFDCDTNQIMETLGGLVLPSEFFETNEVTGISHAMAEKFGRHISAYMNYIAKIFTADCYLVGHNAFGFDKPILERYFVGTFLHLQEANWIDTMLDIPYKDGVGSLALVNLCAQHNFLNPFPHRAIFDVASMFKLIQLYNIKTILEVAATPLCWYKANVSYETRNTAKKLRYRWDSTNKFWVKQFREYNEPDELQKAVELNFSIAKLPGYEFGRQHI